jgi:putative chitinase
MLLKNGSKGDDVKKLQEKLGLTADGAFGPGTEAKVKAWQAANGLTADGLVGAGTWAKMFGSAPAAAPVAATAAPVTIPASSFKLEALRGHIPDAVIAQIPDTALKFNITNTLRLAHFLAQAGHESGGFKAVNENLNYSADGLKKIFGKYFPGNLNESYARKPEKIANRVYASRMGNGDEASGDGWKYKGSGFIQLTGKANHQAFDKTVDDDIMANPSLVATKYPLASAAWFFNNNKLWSICDKGADKSVVEAVTKRVNGGRIGIEDRWKHFQEYYNLLK